MTIDAGAVFGRGISFPPRVGASGRVMWSEGEQNVREAVRIILMTTLRERLRLPDFGGSLGIFLFEPNTVTTRHSIQEHIAAALDRWEPRIAVDAIDVEQDPQDAQAAIATISYRLVATQTQEQVSITVTLAG